MAWKRRHQWSFDLRQIPNRTHKAVIQHALNECDYPFSLIRKRHGVRVPVAVKTLQYAEDGAGSSDHDSHDHSHGVHPLTDQRHQALGLYWLPTPAYPVGRIEVAVGIMDDPDLAREVFLAEAAHAVDYGAMTDDQRATLFTIVHHGDPTPHGTHGWWEERGGQNYWADWVGETFMALFMRAFAPSLPRPLEARQPWTHRVDDDMARQARAVLLAGTA
jgi:hypothetical protein